MNVKSILIWAMAVGTLSSCMSNEDMYDPEKAEAMKVAKYEVAFVKKYGKVDPKQDWGFGEAETTVATKSEWTESNQWRDALILPPIIEKGEQDRVIEAFSHEIKNRQSEEIKWSDFFIQEVYQNTNAQYMNNFRYGNNNPFAHQGKIITRNPHRGDQQVNENIVFYRNEPLGGKFTYMCTLYNNDNKLYSEENYFIQKVGDGYYVGFDFQSDGEDNQKVVRDYIYNDVIFKIVPAEYKNTHRIMVEDLSVDAGSDFDFNDVVFDAVIREEWTPYPGSWEGYTAKFAIITLRAAGGTIPLYIGEQDEAHEVHHLFGVDTKTMVNTNAGAKDEKEVVIFRLEGINSLKDIPIFVGDSTVPLPVLAGTAPAKLCCPTNCEWADERQSIEEEYNNFEKAVGDGAELWYEY